MSELAAVLFAAAITLAVLYTSSSRHPLTRCKRCHGNGILRSVVLPWRYRPCPRCGRSGEIRGRFGRK
ncbi:hypothetical protein ACWENQ_08250 [Nonomuraea sp. NPDC004354]